MCRLSKHPINEGNVVSYILDGIPKVPQIMDTLIRLKGKIKKEGDMKVNYAIMVIHDTLQSIATFQPLSEVFKEYYESHGLNKGNGNNNGNQNDIDTRVSNVKSNGSRFNGNKGGNKKRGHKKRGNNQVGRDFKRTKNNKKCIICESDHSPFNCKNKKDSGCLACGGKHIYI